MKTVTIQITEEEAEEIVISLVFRSLQEGIVDTSHGDKIENLGERLAEAFGKSFNWQHNLFLEHYDPTIKVKVK